jgi:hypothetical protein
VRKLAVKKYSFNVNFETTEANRDTVSQKIKTFLTNEKAAGTIEKISGSIREVQELEHELLQI